MRSVSFLTCAWLLSLRSLFAADVSLEYTYFYPDRYDASDSMRARWGDPYMWPIKCLPHTAAGDTHTGYDTAYGLVYWPGETVSVHLKGVDAARVTSVTVSTKYGARALTATGAGTTWTISIPAEAEAKYLALYRVHAWIGANEVTSRGLVVTKPWGGMFRHDGTGDRKVGTGNPQFPRAKRSFGEWRNGSNPFWQMAIDFHEYFFGVEDVMFPWRERPWGDVDLGLLEIYWPRVNYVSRNINYMYRGDSSVTPAIPADPDHTTAMYGDPSYEWNYLWCYHGRGLGRWRADWQWGPFNRASASWIRYARNIDPIKSGDGDDKIDLIYSDLRQISGAYPNGMLFYQWMYPGLVKLAQRDQRGAYGHVDGRYELPEMDWLNYDGWYDNSLVPDWNMEAGMVDLYWRKCVAQSLPTDWAVPGASFRSLIVASNSSTNAFHPLSDGLRRVDLFERNLFALQSAAWESYRRTTGKTTVDYVSSSNGVPIQEGTPLTSTSPDMRPKRAPINAQLSRGFGAGVATNAGNGDYSHLEYTAYGASTTWINTRFHRGRGYQNASICGLWPECFYGGGQRMTGFVPGTPAIDGGTLTGIPLYATYLPAVRDDGTSYRRIDLFERVPMFYRSGGVLVGCELAACFGHAGTGIQAPSNPLWTTQLILGMNAIEIPDRKRPIGGVFVFDSNNTDARATQTDYVAYSEYPGDPSGVLTEYVTALHDALGIVTFANPDTAGAIPAGVARIHAPRRDGSNQVYLIAEVDGARIRVPLNDPGGADKPGNLTASHPAVQSLIAQTKAAKVGGWPISASGGFVATAWESSKGVWVHVENPPEIGAVHVARRGAFTVRCRGMTSTPVVIDLCGGSNPDPALIPLAQIARNGEWLTIALDWTRGDARLFFIDWDENQPPTISAIANQVTPINTPIPTIPCTVADLETPAGNLVMGVVSSSNPVLLPLTGVVFGGAGGNRTVTLTPATNISGSSVVTIQVADGGGRTASQAFQVTVTGSGSSVIPDANLTYVLSGPVPALATAVLVNGQPATLTGGVWTKSVPASSTSAVVAFVASDGSQKVRTFSIRTLR